MPPLSPKSRARQRTRAARENLPPEGRESLHTATQNHLRRVISGVAGEQPCCVAAYAPLPGEPGGADLPEFLLSTGARVILPRIVPISGAAEARLTGPLAKQLEWVEFTGDNLHSGTWGIREPAGEPITHVDELCQLFIVPALAVDYRGYRLGQGGGFYDRAFASFSPQPTFAGNVYALINDEEFVPEIPAEPHDLTVNAVITPSGVHITSHP